MTQKSSLLSQVAFESGQPFQLTMNLDNHHEMKQQFYHRARHQSYAFVTEGVENKDLDDLREH